MRSTWKFFAALALAVAVRAEDAEPPPAEPPVTDDPATWPAEVKTAYEAIRAFTAAEKDAGKKAIFALAGKGRLARPAIAAIANQNDLPEPQRAFGGILTAHFARFDTQALRKLAEGANPFAQREAVTLLCSIGGKENADFMTALGEKPGQSGLKMHIEKELKNLRSEPLPARALELLDQVINGPAEKKKWAAVALSEDFGKSVAPELQRIIPSLVSDDDARTFASIALVHVNADSVAGLESLCARSNHRTLRYLAVKELATKGPEGEAVLRKLLEDPEEPLKPNIEKLIGANGK
jgi:hypothetical protein